MQGVASALPPKVVIVGGGIGGLTAALALLKRGIDVEVYEQSAVLKWPAFNSAQTAPASSMLSA